jgi:Leucine-rich repeat (LRR) protein
MKISAKLFILFLCLETSDSLTLQCEYKFRQFTWETSLIEDYGCKATIVPDAEKSFITAVSQNHSEGMTFDDVRLLYYAREQTIPQLPKLGFKFYPKLEAFSASRVSLERISSRDFLNLPSCLRIVFLYNNKLREIPSDLFRFTPNVEVVALNGNQIKHVGNNFLDSLNVKTLQKLGIFENSCTNFEVVGMGNEKKIDELKIELKTKCQPTQQMIEEEEKLKDLEVVELLHKMENLTIPEN